MLHTYIDTIIDEKKIYAPPIHLSLKTDFKSGFPTHSLLLLTLGRVLLKTKSAVFFLVIFHLI